MDNSTQDTSTTDEKADEKTEKTEPSDVTNAIDLDAQLTKLLDPGAIGNTDATREGSTSS